MGDRIRAKVVRKGGSRSLTNPSGPHSALGGKPPAMIYWTEKRNKPTRSASVQKSSLKITPDPVKDCGRAQTSGLEKPLTSSKAAIIRPNGLVSHLPSSDKPRHLVIKDASDVGKRIFGLLFFAMAQVGKRLGRLVSRQGLDCFGLCVDVRCRSYVRSEQQY